MQSKLALFFSAALVCAAPAWGQQASTVAQLQAPTDLSVNTDQVHDLSITPDGARAVSRAANRVTLIDVDSGAVLANDVGPGAPANGTGTMANSVATTNTRAIVAGIAGNVTIYDISSGALTVISTFNPGFTNGELAKELAITPNGKRAVVAYHNADTQVFALDTGALLTTPGALQSAGPVYGANANLNALRVTDTHAVVVGNRIRVFDIDAAAPFEILTPALQPSLYFDVEIAPDGGRAIARAFANAPNNATHSFQLLMGGGGATAVYEGAFANPGQTQMTLPFANPNTTSTAPVPRASLEDSIVMSPDKAILLGITPGADEATSIANVQIINFATAPPSLTPFQLPGFAHDLEMDPLGNHGVVHSSLGVGVFAPNAVGGPALTATLASPGSGFLAYVFSNPTMITLVIPRFAENSVVIEGNRAIVIGSTLLTATTSDSTVMVYDLGQGGLPPSLIAQYDTPNDGLPPFLNEIQTTPQGGLAGIAADGQSIYIETSTGNLVGTLAAPATFQGSLVHGIELTNTRSVRLGTSLANRPQYALDQLSQLPYNQGVAVPNTTGLANSLSSTGSLSIAANSFSIVSSNFPVSGGAPASQALLFYAFGLNGPTPLNDGLLYIGPQIFRVTPVAVPVTADPFTIPVDFTTLPVGGGIGAFQEVHFQVWYRDAASPGGANLSDVHTVSFGL